MNKKHLWLALLILVVVFLLVPLFLGDNSFITVYDVLDSEFIYFHLLKINHLLFSTSPDAVVENVMNGLPRSYFHSEYNIIRMLFYCLPSLYAFHVNAFLVRLIGFAGMLLLTKDYLLKEKKGYVIPVALSFAFIPLYTIYGISVSGIPFLFWSFLNLRNNRRKISSWIVISVFPFYAHLALVAPFIVALLFCYGLYILIQRENVNYQYWAGIAVLIFFFIVSEISMIKSFMGGGVASHREAWVIESFPLRVIIMDTLKVFFRGHYHVSSFVAIPIFLLIILTMTKFGNKNKNVLVKLSIALGLLFVIAVFYTTYYAIVEQFSVFKILSSFQFRRFTFLAPLILFSAFALAIEHSTLSRRIIVALLFFQFALIAYSNNELKLDLMRVAGLKTDGYYFSMPSFRQFFEPELFSSIREYIGKPQEEYRVVCIDFYPSIAQYNGFYTLDGYQNNYPLSYKEQFMEVIEPELQKDSTLKKPMTNWASKCYIISAELWKTQGWLYEIPKASRSSIHELSIRTEVLKEMGCQYILSTVPIENYEQLGLKLDKTFISDKSFWDIYLYKIN